MSKLYFTPEGSKLIYAGDVDSVICQSIAQWDSWSLVDCIKNFQWLTYKALANKLIDGWDGSSVADDLEKFKWLDHNEIALKLIKSGQRKDVVRNLEKFKGLNQEIINLLK